MSQDNSIAKILLIALLASLVFYVGGFSLNEYLRQRRGPWEITFASPNAQTTSITITQPHLRIGPVTLNFTNATELLPSAKTVRFDTARTTIPLGQVKYDDLTYLPGVVTLDLLGHEIEVLPRLLYIDRQPFQWTDVRELSLEAITATDITNTPASEPQTQQVPSATKL
ncbi:MAG: hypothetical protein RI897_4192 [Verrucomicrobiota bacterium]